MSRGQRIGLLAAAVAVAVAAFVIAKPDSDDESTSNTTTQAAETKEEKTPAPKPKPEVTRIELKAHQPVGGPKSIKVKKGDGVRVVVTSDAPDEVHLHGYDITREVGPGKPARLSFKADLEGAFEMESHESEERIAALQVEPR
jgi:FtsP/CotA-like multicopper oxidase with cupredoxin domain